MSQQQKKRKWKTFGKKNKKEAAAKVAVVRNKLNHLDQIFAGSSAEEDSSHHDNTSNGSSDEDDAIGMHKRARSQQASSTNLLLAEEKDHSEEQLHGSNSSSSSQPRKSTNYQRKMKTPAEEEEEEEEDSQESSREEEVEEDEEEEAEITNDEEDDDSSRSAGEDNDDNSEHSHSEDDTLIPTTTAATTKAQNMARAMARLLGASSSADNEQDKVVVLSKTITKIQKLQSEARMEQSSLSLKQSERKQINLSSMYIPPPIRHNNKISSKATASTNKALVAQEVQNDRIYRRIATRGVVALFNAISQHQREQQQQQQQKQKAADASDKTKSSVSTQRDFIDKIKESVTIKQQEQTLETQNKNGQEKVSTAGANKKSSGWNALKDDYMMSSNNLKVSVLYYVFVCLPFIGIFFVTYVVASLNEASC